MLFVQVRFMGASRGGATNFTIAEARPDQLTLSLAEGSTWIEVREVHLTHPLSVLRCQHGVVGAVHIRLGEIPRQQALV